MAFFSTARGLPILDHVTLFCRLLQGGHAGGGPPPSTGVDSVPWGRIIMHLLRCKSMHYDMHAASPTVIIVVPLVVAGRRCRVLLLLAGWGVCLQHLNKSVTIPLSFNSGLFS